MSTLLLHVCRNIDIYFGYFSKQGASGNAPPPGTPNTDDYLEPTHNSTDIPEPHANVTSGPFTDGFMDILGTDPFAGRVGINGTVFWEPLEKEDSHWTY